ncbi:MAG: hypothetical protein FGF48_04915 [Candidatus Brockarchaeota archaeon]|nr:hypothetical protein [Candidatus Brockarchaeota archaeon]
MSWVQSVKNALEQFEISFEETGRGNLVAKPLENPQIRLIILVRRMQFSFDRKFEMVGVLEIPEDRLKNRDKSQLLKRMLSESVELELKGVLRRSLKASRWSGLSSLPGVTMLEGEGLLQVVRSREVEELVKQGGGELIEIFPSLIPVELFETYLMASDRGPVISTLVKKHMESPQSISWIVRMHMLYGVQSGGVIRRAFLTVVNLLKKIEEYTYTRLLP